MEGHQQRQRAEAEADPVGEGDEVRGERDARGEVPADRREREADDGDGDAGAEERAALADDGEGLRHFVSSS